MSKNRSRTLYWSSTASMAVTALFISQSNDFLLVKTLAGTPSDVGVANALETAAFLFLSLPAGRLLARWRTASIQAVTAAGDALLLAVLLGTLIQGVLTVPLLWALSAVAGLFAVAHGIASSSMVSRMFEESLLAKAASRRSALVQTCGIVIPALSGVALEAAGPSPLVAAALLLASVSAVLMLRLRTAEPKPEELDSDGVAARRDGGQGSPRRQGRGIVRGARGHQLLAISAALLLSNAGLALGSSVTTVYENRILGLGFDAIGAAVAAGAVGGVLGALAAEPLMARIGGRALRSGTCAVLGLCVAVLWAAADTGELAFWAVAGQSALYGFVMSVFNVAIFTWASSAFRGRETPRVMGLLQTVGYGSVPAGALAGGALGDVIGPRQTLLVWLVLVLAALAVALLPVGREESGETPSEARGSEAAPAPGRVDRVADGGSRPSESPPARVAE